MDAVTLVFSIAALMFAGACVYAVVLWRRISRDRRRSEFR